MLLIALSCGPKATPADSTVAIAAGWHSEHDWKGSCFVAPDFSALSDSSRDNKRVATASAMAMQWRGDRSDGVRFGTDLVSEVEALLRAVPSRVDAVAADNLAHCEQLMLGAVGTMAWGSWLESLPDSLQAGECVQNVTEPLYHHLDLALVWQFPVELCPSETVRIIVSSDAYRMVAGGPWITAEGTEGEPDETSPCSAEGARPGMLVARLGDTCVPVGLGTTFTASQAGTLEVALNDADTSDNAWREVDFVRDRISVEVAPE